jgi:chorismate synthase
MSNTFGKIFKITTFGESHGKIIGVVIDGCPANLPITEKEINKELLKRNPKNFPFTTKRNEEDKAKILSGVFKNKTTGAPICIVIENKDPKKKDYEKIKDLYRPGHNNFTYHQKYGIVDPYGGGRGSARETAARVAAGAIAKKLLKILQNIEILAFVKKIGSVEVILKNLDFYALQKKLKKSVLNCPDKTVEKKMVSLLKNIEKEKDSIGGICQLITTPINAFLGDPIFEKLSCNLAKACFSIPAAVGFEIGNGFLASSLKGSKNNDIFKISKNKKIITKTNNCGGILGGISTGMPLNLKVAFKPTSSIKKPQKTLNFKRENKEIILNEDSRHDLCVAIRGAAVIEAMVAITLMDSFLMNKTAGIEF